MPNQKKTPRIRFAGFTEEWEQRKVGEIASYRRGSFPQPYGKSEWYDGEGAMPFVQVADVSDEMDLVDDTKQKISILAQPLSFYAEKNSVLVTLQGSIGRVAITQYGAFVDRTVLIFEKYKDEIDKTFWAYIIKQKFIDEAQKAPGGTIKTITKEALSDFNLSIPNYKEQQQIGLYFRSLDTLITLHQRKLEKLKIVKKSCLENMFPRNGEKIPRIRFAGFTEEWEQRKVSEIADRYDNLRIPVAANLRVPGSTPYYGANGIQDYVDGYTHEGEFVLVAEDGANDLKNYPVKCVEGRIWVNNHAHVLQGKTQFANNQYLALSINQADIESLLVGGGRAKLNAETLMQIEVSLPNLEEQRLLGNYFHNLDNLITLHQRKVEKLKQIKAACLNNMFI